MGKKRFLTGGKQAEEVNVYSEDHYEWGSALAYCDIDGVEWVKHQGLYRPVAVIEECRMDRVVERKEWQLARTRQLAELLSRACGYTVRSFFLRWTAEDDREIGERVQSILARRLDNGREVPMARAEWIAYLQRLRDNFGTNSGEELPDNWHGEQATMPFDS